MQDGTTIVSEISMPTTGSWTTWSETSSIDVELSAGTILLRLEATSSGGLANIDYMEITGDGVSAVACTGLKSSNSLVETQGNSSDLTVNFYPNPVNDQLVIVFSKELTEEVEIQVSDVSGKLIQSGLASGNKHQLDFTSLKNGLYIVNIKGDNMNFVKTIAKE
jgi:hypothetical protein